VEPLRVVADRAKQGGGAVYADPMLEKESGSRVQDKDLEAAGEFGDLGVKRLDSTRQGSHGVLHSGYDAAVVERVERCASSDQRLAP